MATGRNDGLCQDYNRKLHLWFASRVDARHTVRRWFGDPTRKDMAKFYIFEADDSFDPDNSNELLKFDPDNGYVINDPADFVQFKCQAARDAMVNTLASGDLQSEEFGFAMEMAYQYGAVHVDGDASIVAMREQDLFVMMKLLGYGRKAGAAQQADPLNPGWCIGCNPDNCVGCGVGLSTPQGAQP